MGISTVEVPGPPRTAGNFMNSRNMKDYATPGSVNNDRFTSTSTANGLRPLIGAAAISKRPPSGRIFTGSKDL